MTSAKYHDIVIKDRLTYSVRPRKSTMYILWTLAVIQLTSYIAVEGSAEQTCKSSNAKTILDNAVDLINSAKAKCAEENTCPQRPVDCQEILTRGKTKSGVYNIWPRNRVLSEDGVKVFCDMDTNDGGWTVIQRRGNYGRSKEFFYKNWLSYEDGFGDITQDFWLGNRNIYAISNQRQYSIRFDLMDLNGERRNAVYDYFWIDNAESNYTLHVTGYSGTAGDSFGGHTNTQFSTFDRDNDKHESNCAQTYKGGWWYAACHTSNLNGLYLHGEHKSFADGVEWKSWTGYNYSLPFTEMKIRPLYFNPVVDLPEPN